MASGHRVAIVVGQGSGAALERIAVDRHVWAIRTSEYQHAADEVRRNSPRHSPECGVTLFAPINASPEDEVISILGTVEEHHSEYSRDPPLDEVEVIGAEPTPEVRAELSAFGFTDIAPSERGFVASRRA
jgi:hypothetical protein